MDGGGGGNIALVIRFGLRVLEDLDSLSDSVRRFDQLLRETSGADQ